MITLPMLRLLSTKDELETMFHGQNVVDHVWNMVEK